MQNPFDIWIELKPSLPTPTRRWRGHETPSVIKKNQLSLLNGWGVGTVIKGGGILWHIWSRGSQNPVNGAKATFIDGSGWCLVWWFLFSRTAPKNGYFSVPSAAVKAKIENTLKISCNISFLGFSKVGISKMRSVFKLRIPSYPLPLGALLGGG